MFMEINIKV